MTSGVAAELRIVLGELLLLLGSVFAWLYCYFAGGASGRVCRKRKRRVGC